MGQVNAGCRDWIKQIPAKYAATLQIKAQPKIEESRITQQSETIIIPAQSTMYNLPLHPPPFCDWVFDGFIS